jgi:pantoate--beta-alanine ligase
VLVTTRIDDLRAALASHRQRGARIGFVPTMGSLHDGHLALVDWARADADVVVMSIFVNPLQFAAHEDFGRYPRDAEGDAAKAAARGVDILWIPTVDEMTPADDRLWPVRVVPSLEPARWEAAARPGHFTGVLTIVAKLFHIVQPDVAVFGQKDVQQLTLVRAMVRGLDIPVRLIAAPTSRDADGLALSSRNAYLDADERRSAVGLSRALAAVQRSFASGQRHADQLEACGRAALAETPGVDVDYLAVVEPDRLEPVREAVEGTVVMVAARVGRTRLLDNIVLSAGG